MSRSLPASIDAIEGLRAARWFRESTPASTTTSAPTPSATSRTGRSTRYGLVDTGLEWSVAASGWKDAWRTPAWEAMLAAAEAGAFDVLVVGYVSRFLRNLKQTLIAVEDHLQPAGVVGPVRRRAAPLERSRPLGPVRPRGARGRGLQPQAQQAGPRGLRREAPPARRPGWQPGPLRDHPRGPPLGPADRRAEGRDRPPGLRARGGRLHRLGGRRPDRARQDPRRRDPDQPDLHGAAADGRAGRDRPDHRARALLAVQTARERRRTRTPGRIVKRNYALRLRCLGCGRYLYGDVGRYRHPAPTCPGVPDGAIPMIRRAAAADHDDTPDQGPLLSAGLVRGRGRGDPGPDRAGRRRDDQRGRPAPRRLPAAGRRADPRPDRAGPR